MGVTPHKDGVGNDGAPGITNGETMLAIDKVVGVPVIHPTAPAMTLLVQCAESVGVLVIQLPDKTGSEGTTIGMAGCGSRCVDLENVPEGFEAHDDDIGEGSVAMATFGQKTVETTGCFAAVSSVAVAVMLGIPGVDST